MNYSSIRLPKTIIIEVLRMMDCGEVFKNKLHTLNRNIYYDPNVKEYLYGALVLRNLGIIEDYYFEIRYFEKLLDIKIDGMSSLKLNYRNLENL